MVIGWKINNKNKLAVIFFFQNFLSWFFSLHPSQPWLSPNSAWIVAVQKPRNGMWSAKRFVTILTWNYCAKWSMSATHADWSGSRQRTRYGPFSNSPQSSPKSDSPALIFCDLILYWVLPALKSGHLVFGLGLTNFFLSKPLHRSFAQLKAAPWQRSQELNPRQISKQFQSSPRTFRWHSRKSRVIRSAGNITKW